MRSHDAEIAWSDRCFHAEVGSKRSERDRHSQFLSLSLGRVSKLAVPGPGVSFGRWRMHPLLRVKLASNFHVRLKEKRHQRSEVLITLHLSSQCITQSDIERNTTARLVPRSILQRLKLVHQPSLGQTHLTRRQTGGNISYYSFLMWTDLVLECKRYQEALSSVRHS